MNWKLRAVLCCICLALTGQLALATVPISIYPNPVQFGIVPATSPSQPQYILVTNKLATPVSITAMTIAGADPGDFAFDGTCVGSISGNQTCEMYMVFTPPVLGSRTATLQITVSGQTTTVNIPLEGTGGNPIPNVTSISPATVYVNSPTKTVTINGSGFLSSSVVYVSNYQNNSAAVPTTYVSANKLTAQIPDTFFSGIGSDYIYVSNPQPGGGGGSSATLQIVQGEPSITYTSPTSIVAGTASEPIIINGQNFMSTATVQWNGATVPTTFISPTQLQIQPTTSLLSTGGIVQLTVTNPSPGTISQFVNFNVTDPITVTVLDLPANDLVWDPFAQVLYASLPSSYGVNGNSIAVINPSTGAVTGYYFAGSEPGKLALDANSKYLYVGLNGAASVQQLNLPGFTAGVNINLGSGNVAGAIAVSPTNASTIAIGLGSSYCCYSTTLEFFTGTTKLNSLTNADANQLIFASGTTLYGYLSNNLEQFTVSSTGGSLSQTWSGIVDGAAISYSGGLIFGGDGQEFNPSTGQLLGTFDVNGSTCCAATLVLSNSNINRAFVLGTTPFEPFGITSYNLTQFTPLVVSDLTELSTQYNSPSVSKFIQWSTNGMAFLITSGCCGTASTQVVLVQSPTLLLTKTASASPLPLLTTLSKTSVAHGKGNFRLTVKGSGFVPGSVVTWNGKAMSASYVSGAQMTVYVPGSATASPGTATIRVKNPSPGGGASQNSLTLTIN